MMIRRPPVAAFLALCAACSNSDNNGGGTPVVITSNPCSRTDTVTLAPAGTALADCSNGGTTVTLAAGGASYLIVPQFATTTSADQAITYTLARGSLTTAAGLATKPSASFVGAATPTLPADVPGPAQRAFESRILARPRGTAGSTLRAPTRLMTPPTLGSTATFSVESGTTTLAFKTVTATLSYLGNNIYLYIDNNSPANGFTPTQLTQFGQLFDQTLYPITTAAFGPPSDVDGNGHVIVLMSPVVNSLSPSSQCSTQGYVAGFFEPADLDGTFGVHSNNAEIFYSIVPDPSGTASCAHSVSGVGLGVPSTFMHELQHLINYSQHAVLHHQGQGASWLDEGMSIVAEELGSLYYEQKCPTPACRTNPAQIFPDSSQGFAQSFLYDSYEYALLPDTASITGHNDSQNGFSWRGGNWLLVRYLADQYGQTVLTALEQGPAEGASDIAAAAARPFPSVISDFSMALYADSFPGLPRATAPAVDRFTSRNLRQLWARLFVTSPGASDVPRAMPLVLDEIGTTDAQFALHPGTSSYWRLTTSASDGPVTIRFGTAAGGAFGSSLHPQIAIMRLPAGQ